MKRTLSTFAMLLYIALTHAQFAITKNGIVDEKDSTKSYVILQFEGMNADSIISFVSENLHRNMMNNEDKDVRTDNTLYVTGHRNNYIAGKSLGLTFGGARHIIFKFVIEAKDGRAKVEPTEILLSAFGEKSKYPDFVPRSWENAVFKKDGSIRDKTTAESLRRFVNGFVSCMMTKKNEDDW